MLNRAPNFAASLDKDSISIYQLKAFDADIKILTGGQYALYTESDRQNSTDYQDKINLVFVKENGAWKLDLIGSMKLELDRSQAENPNDDTVSGSGRTDLAVTDLSFPSGKIIINDTDGIALVKVKNNGKSTIEHFTLTYEINFEEVVTDEVRHRLEPGEEYILSIPLDEYWNVDSNRTPAEVETAVYVYLGDEENLENNVIQDSVQMKYESTF